MQHIPFIKNGMRWIILWLSVFVSIRLRSWPWACRTALWLNYYEKLSHGWKN